MASAPFAAEPDTDPAAAEVAERPAAEHARLLLPRVGGCVITGELASGGLAVVYRAVQESLGRPVAIKALRSDVVAAAGREPEEPDWIGRFLREGRLLAELQHENLVHVYDLIDARVSTPDGGQAGSIFLVMELCEGLDLLDALERLGPGATLPADVAVLIGLGAAAALSHIHARGILHRDVKPANLFLTRHGVVKLLDFGTAWDPQNPRDVGGDEIGLGTPGYMSPEQVLGGPLDGRSDQFALGVVLYQLLAGRKPFVEAAGEGPGSLLSAITRAQPVPLRRLNREVPGELLAIVGRCLSREPAGRFATTDELVQALRRLADRLIAGSHAQRLVGFLVERGLLDAAAAREVLAPFGPPPWPAPAAPRPASWPRRLLARLGR